MFRLMELGKKQIAEKAERDITCQSHCSQSVFLLVFHILTAVFPVFLLHLLAICLYNLILYLVCVGVLLGLSASHVGDQCEWIWNINRSQTGYVGNPKPVVQATEQSGSHVCSWRCQNFSLDMSLLH